MTRYTDCGSLPIFKEAPPYSPHYKNVLSPRVESVYVVNPSYMATTRGRVQQQPAATLPACCVCSQQACAAQHHQKSVPYKAKTTPRLATAELGKYPATAFKQRLSSPRVVLPQAPPLVPIEPRESTSELRRAEAARRKTRDILAVMDSQLEDLVAPSSAYRNYFTIAPERSVFYGWKVLSILGSGTFASVYKIVNVETRRVAAAKLLEPQKFCPSTQQRVVEMFAKEIRYSVLCQCPGVVRVGKVVRGVEGWMVIQELVDGGTLWGNYATTDELDSFCLFLQLTQTLMHMQDLAVVHRDLKPTNILRTPDRQRLLIADFGWSEAYDDLNVHTHELPGTIEINPPEVLAHRTDQTSKLDNYALGLNLLLLLGKQFVCRDKSLPPSDAAKKVLSSISNLRAGAPVSGFSPDAWDVFLGLTHFNPAKRLTLHEVIKTPWFLTNLSRLLRRMSPVEIQSLTPQSVLTGAPLLWHGAVRAMVLQQISKREPTLDTISSCSTHEFDEDGTTTDPRSSDSPQGSLAESCSPSGLLRGVTMDRYSAIRDGRITTVSTSAGSALSSFQRDIDARRDLGQRVSGQRELGQTFNKQESSSGQMSLNRQKNASGQMSLDGQKKSSSGLAEHQRSVSGFLVGEESASMKRAHEVPKWVVPSVPFSRSPGICRELRGDSTARALRQMLSDTERAAHLIGNR